MKLSLTIVRVFVTACASMSCVAFLLAGADQEVDDRPPYESGIVWPEPKVVDPGPVGGPPSDAIVLFDGTNLDQWNGGEKWDVKDGVATARSASISTKQSFGDCQLHLEWASPAKVEGSGQGRGNSGVDIMDRYEVQILDSFDNKTYFDGQCGAIYKQRPPMVNASRKPGQWQTYDIIFTAPRFGDSGKLEQPAYVTVLHNGVVIQNHTKIVGTTAYRDPPVYQKHPAKLPIYLQYHHDSVRFRNIWVREFAAIKGKLPPETNGR